jgi:predicted metal-binding membrane protein
LRVQQRQRPALDQGRIAALLGLSALAGCAWWLPWQRERAMATMHGEGLPGALALAMLRPATAPNYLVITTGMSVVMMLAIMTPAGLPVLLTFWRMDRHGSGAVRGADTWPGLLFAFGYLDIWSAAARAFAVLQWLLHQAAMLDTHVVQAPRWLSSGLLVAAGDYQLTPVKASCLRFCQSPFTCLLGNWRAGRQGAVLMGATLGLFCMGCCWALMLLMFVSGVMSVGMMALLCVLNLAERLLPFGRLAATLPGLALIAWGLLLFAAGV